MASFQYPQLYLKRNLLSLEPNLPVISSPDWGSAFAFFGMTASPIKIVSHEAVFLFEPQVLIITCSNFAFNSIGSKITAMAMQKYIIYSLQSTQPSRYIADKSRLETFFVYNFVDLFPT